MIDLIEHTGTDPNPGSYTSVQDIPAERSGFDDRKGMPQSSSKYILDGNNNRIRKIWPQRRIDFKGSVDHL